MNPTRSFAQCLGVPEPDAATPTFEDLMADADAEARGRANEATAMAAGTKRHQGERIGATAAAIFSAGRQARRFQSQGSRA